MIYPFDTQKIYKVRGVIKMGGRVVVRTCAKGYVCTCVFVCVYIHTSLQQGVDKNKNLPSLQFYSDMVHGRFVKLGVNQGVGAVNI